MASLSSRLCSNNLLQHVWLGSAALMVPRCRRVGGFEECDPVRYLPSHKALNEQPSSSSFALVSRGVVLWAGGEDASRKAISTPNNTSSIIAVSMAPLGQILFLRIRGRAKGSPFLALLPPGSPGLWQREQIISSWSRFTDYNVTVGGHSFPGCVV